VHPTLSIFPAGRPGAGLLLLRTGAGIAIALPGVHQLAGAPCITWMCVGGLLAIITGAALLAGFMTPIAGSLGVLAGVGLAASGAPSPGALVAIVSAGIVLLGPGAYSIDGLRFGRQELLIPAFRKRDTVD
jgi:hypothetical protein